LSWKIITFAIEKRGEFIDLVKNYRQYLNAKGNKLRTHVNNQVVI